MDKAAKAFSKHKEQLQADFAQAFTKALEQMGDKATSIDWFAGNGSWQ